MQNEENKERIEQLRSMENGTQIKVSSIGYYLDCGETKVARLIKEGLLKIHKVSPRRRYTTKEELIECYDKISNIKITRNRTNKNVEPRIVILSDMTNWGDKLLDTANTFKEKHQIIKLFEELSELQSELARYILGEREVKLKNIQEEIADVYIVLAQMCYFFDSDRKLKSRIESKLKELDKKMQNYRDKRCDAYNPLNATQGEIDFDHLL